MDFIKGCLTAIGLKNTAKWFRDFYLLCINYFQDAVNYYKYSYVFKMENFDKIEADIIMSYHSIEKGFLHAVIRPRFAQNKVKIIIKNIAILEEKKIVKLNSQIVAAINVLIKYYDFHLEREIDIDDFYTRSEYENFLKLKNTEFSAVHEIDKNSFYKDRLDDFKEFSNSRKSLRDFTGETVDIELLNNVIKLSNNSPSVCNRQSCSVYLLNDKKIIEKVLGIQGGFSGYERNVNQLLILVSNKNSFFSIGERNQLYIDGGIYLMNLLYALHYYKIAACPANWGKCVSDDKNIRKHVKIPKNEQIICIIPIGIATQNIVYAHSERRIAEETLKVL